MSRKMVQIAVSMAVVAMGVAGGVWYTGSSVNAQEQERWGNVATTNLFHGTYEGGYWGSVTGYGPYGGDVKATVDTLGKIKITLPGAGTGTVSSTGTYTATGSLKVQGQTLSVSYTGTLKPTKHPTTGAYLAVVGNGTWKVTTPGVVASGKWLVRRTLTTP